MTDRPNLQRPEPPKPPAPLPQSWVSVAFAVAVAIAVMAVLALLSFSLAMPVLGLGAALVAFMAIQYFAWGRWLGPKIRDQVEAEERAEREQK